VRAALASRALPPDLNGDPNAVGPAILKLADAENPPLRLFLGTVPTLMVPGVYQARLAEWDAWKDVSLAATQVQHG
jgi:hypothetical protein